MRFKGKMLILLLLLFFTAQHAYSAKEKTIYFIPGQGADARLFDSLQIDSSYKLVILEYDTPGRKESMKDFAMRFVEEIDTTENFILVGTSLGGMICVELSEELDPEKTIIISSAKNRNEFPFHYSFQKFVPLYEIIPASLLYSGAKVAQPLFEPDRNNNKETFQSMLKNKDPEYMKNTIRIIMQWDRTSNTKEIIHIHGTNDRTLPYKKIKSVDHTVENGSHMMTLTRADVISEIINDTLKE